MNASTTSPTSCRRLRVAAILLSLSAAACGDEANPLGPGEPGDAVVAEVRLEPGEVTLEVGASRVLAPTVRGSDGRVLRGRAVTWRSTDPSVASVDAAGRVTARRAGSASIVAEAGGRRGSAQLQVRDVPIATLEVTPGALVLEPGAALEMAVRARAADGSEVPLQGWWNRVTWTSSDPVVATVRGAGRVETGRGGVATITATVDGVSARATVTVPLELAFDLRRVGGRALPAVLLTEYVRNDQGVWARRWTTSTAGTLTLSTVDGTYRQRFTLQVAEERFWIVDGQAVPCCTVVVESREVVEEGTVGKSPTRNEYFFTSTTTEAHRFVAQREPNHGGFLARFSIQGRGDAFDFEYVKR